MKDSGPAFPQHGWTKDTETLKRMQDQGGMSLRDWFAGMALTHPYAQGGDTHFKTDKAAAWAYELADAMLAERDKEA